MSAVEFKTCSKCGELSSEMRLGDLCVECDAPTREENSDDYFRRFWDPKKGIDPEVRRELAHLRTPIFAHGRLPVEMKTVGADPPLPVTEETIDYRTLVVEQSKEEDSSYKSTKREHETLWSKWKGWFR